MWFAVFQITVAILLTIFFTAFGLVSTNTIIHTGSRAGQRFQFPNIPLSSDRDNFSRNSNDDHDAGADVVLENEEPLSVIFQRGLVMQRSGDHEGALKEYKFFVKAAERCGVSPKMFAEVHVNIGAVYFKGIQDWDLAKHHFEIALKHRPNGMAYVNLALIALRKGSNAGPDDPVTGRSCLEEAQSNLKKAIELNDSDQSKAAAIRLLQDVEAIMGQMK